MPIMTASGLGVLGGAAILGVLAGAWNKIKELANRFSSLFIVRAVIHGTTATAIAAYCWSHCRRSPFGDRTYDTMHTYIRPKDMYDYVAMETIGESSILFWHDRKPIWCGIKSQGNGNSAPEDEKPIRDQLDGLHISFIRGMFNLDELIIDSLDYYRSLVDGATSVEDHANSRFFITHVIGDETKMETKNNQRRSGGVGTLDGSRRRHTRIVKWKPEDLGPKRVEVNSALDMLAMPPEIKALVHEFKWWLANHKWYAERSIPWKLSWAIHGVPGTGKTALIRALAFDLDLPVFIYDLATLSNTEFVSAWQGMRNFIPCIALMEDIDNVFEGRKNIAAEGSFKQKMTFDCLLNSMDGVELTEGICTMITTNRIECLDEALGVSEANSHQLVGISTRPGRVDRIIRLPTLDVVCRIQLATRILGNDHPRLSEVVAAGDGDTGSQFQGRCTYVAKEDLWTTEDKHEAI